MGNNADSKKAKFATDAFPWIRIDKTHWICNKSIPVSKTDGKELSVKFVLVVNEVQDSVETPSEALYTWKVLYNGKDITLESTQKETASLYRAIGYCEGVFMAQKANIKKQQ